MNISGGKSARGNKKAISAIATLDRWLNDPNQDPSIKNTRLNICKSLHIIIIFSHLDT